MYKIGFMPSGTMIPWEPEKMCAFVREAGYDAIELQSMLVNAFEDAEGRRGRFVAAAESNELLISELVSQRDFVVLDETERKTNIEAVLTDLRIAADMGIGVVNLFTGPQPWLENPVVIGKNITTQKAWELVFDAFDTILPAAEALKIRIAVENVWGMLCHDFFTHKYLNSRYGSAYLGVNLDPSHDVLYGNTDMHFLVNGWGDKIFHVHLKDAVGVPEANRFAFPLLGEGIVNWTAFFSALKGIGYDGCMSVEFESWGYIKTALSGRHEDTAKVSRELIDKLLASVM